MYPTVQHKKNTPDNWDNYYSKGWDMKLMLDDRMNYEGEYKTSTYK